MPDEAVYVRDGADGAAEVILVDLALRDAAPDAARPWLVTADVPLRDPNPAGLRKPEEMDAVEAVQEALLDAAAGVDGVFAGRRTARGTTTFWFHVARADGIAARLGAAVARVPGYAARVEVVEDAGWRHYLERVFPDGARLRTILRERRAESDDAVRAQLAELGDDGAAVRPVDHFTYFPTREDAEAAGRDVASAGLSVKDVTEPAASDPPRRRPWRLLLTGDHAVVAAALDPVADAILDAALPRGGEYDGWECPVTKPARPARGGLLRCLLGR